MSRRRKPSKNKVESIAPQNDSVQKSNSTPGEASVILRSPRNTDNSRYRKEEYTPWWKRVPWMGGLKVIGILAGIGYAFVTFWQWRDLRHNFEVEERPWIKVKLAGEGLPKALPKDVVDKPISMQMEITNVGKTPARNIIIYGFVELVDYDKEPRFLDPNDPSSINNRSYRFTRFGFMFPSDQPFTHLASRLRQSGKGAGEEETLTPGEWQLLDEGKKYIAAHALVVYQDTFGHQHWTTFCNWRGYRQTQYEALGCALYNNADAQ